MESIDLEEKRRQGSHWVRGKKNCVAGEAFEHTIVGDVDYESENELVGLRSLAGGGQQCEWVELSLSSSQLVLVHSTLGVAVGVSRRVVRASAHLTLSDQLRSASLLQLTTRHKRQPTTDTTTTPW